MTDLFLFCLGLTLVVWSLWSVAPVSLAALLGMAKTVMAYLLEWFPALEPPLLDLDL